MTPFKKAQTITRNSTKIIFLGLIAVFCLLSGFSPIPETSDLKKHHLKGRVKTVCLTTYKLQKYTNKIDTEVTSMFFDTSGNIISETDSSRYSIHTMTLDGKGNTVEENWNMAGSYSKVINHFNNKGNMVEQLVFDDNTEENFKDTIINDTDYVLKDNSLKLDFKDTFIYDSAGNETKEFTRRADGTIMDNDVGAGNSLKSRDTFWYDDKKNFVEEHFDSNNTMLTKIYTLFENGKYRENEITDYVRKHITYEMYDEDENPTQVKTYKLTSKKLIASATYLYNENKNLIEIKIERRGALFSKKMRWYYEYDNMGNWLKKTTTSTIDNELETRTITYY